MPVDRGERVASPVSSTDVKHRRAAVHHPALQRSRQNRAAVQEVRGWVVLTSWDGPDRPGMPGMGVSRVGVSGVQERVIFTSYAAVPTAGGWLVIQL